MSVLDRNKVADMFDNLGVSLAVFDREMNMIYMNKKAEDFYKHAFGAENLAGTNVKKCHEDINIRNIGGLFESFDNGKPLSFFNVETESIEGGSLTVVHPPYIIDGKVNGIMELNFESSLCEGGRGEYERKFDK